MGGSMSVKNETDLVLTISLWQVGPLYHENRVQPGETFTRNTGAVWFTVRAWPHSVEHEISAKTIAWPWNPARFVGEIDTRSVSPKAKSADAKPTQSRAVVTAEVGSRLTGATVIGGGALPDDVVVKEFEVDGQVLGVASNNEAKGTSLEEVLNGLRIREATPISMLGWYAGRNHKLKIIGGPKVIHVETRDGEIVPIITESGTPMELVHYDELLPSVSGTTSVKEDHKEDHPLSYVDRMHRYPGVCFLGDCYCATLTSEAQELKWEDVGLSMSIPAGTIPEGDKLDLEVYPCLTGPFVLPDDYEPASPAYLIRSRPSRYQFLKPVELTLQHCFDLQTQEDCESMAFLTASSTPTCDEHSIPKYIFSEISGNRGTFQCGESVGRIAALQHFCKITIGKKRKRSDSESDVRESRRGGSTSAGSQPPTVPVAEAPKKQYSVRLYRTKSPTEQHPLAIFTISLLQKVYITNLTTTLRKTFPGIDFEPVVKEPMQLKEGEVSLTIPTDIPGWRVVSNKTPPKISQEEIDLPMEDKSYAMSEISEYPPKIYLILSRDYGSQPQTVFQPGWCQLEVRGLSRSCGFNVPLPSLQTSHSLPDPQELAGQLSPAPTNATAIQVEIHPLTSPPHGQTPTSVTNSPASLPVPSEPNLAVVVVPLTAVNAVGICDVLTNSGFLPSSWQGLAARLGISDPSSIATQNPTDSLCLQETIRQWLRDDIQVSWEKLADEVSRVQGYGHTTMQNVLSRAKVAAT